jgi:hypothetical protein
MRCLVTSEAARRWEIGEMGAASGVDPNGGNLYLTLALLQLWAEQRAAASGKGDCTALPFHAPYLNILPRRLPSWPLFWSDVDLGLLEGSPVLDQVTHRRSCIGRDWDALREAAEASRRTVPRDARPLCGLDEASAGDYAVAELLVCSRAFSVPGAGSGGRADHCLVPLADMLNTALPHTCDVDFGTRDARPGGDCKGGASAEARAQEGRVFVMSAVHPIKEGRQVHDSYGYKSNDR